MDAAVRSISDASVPPSPLESLAAVKRAASA